MAKFKPLFLEAELKRMLLHRDPPLELAEKQAVRFALHVISRQKKGKTE